MAKVRYMFELFTVLKSVGYLSVAPRAINMFE